MLFLDKLYVSRDAEEALHHGSRVAAGGVHLLRVRQAVQVTQAAQHPQEGLSDHLSGPGINKLTPFFFKLKT